MHILAATPETWNEARAEPPSKPTNQTNETHKSL
jgi:hypothetical protein